MSTSAALEALDIELEALRQARSRCALELDSAIDLISSSSGRLVVSGLGKSGHVGGKIAATLASTGTPSLFVHSTEALHGDSGMVCPEDVALLISYSGRTEEVCQFASMLKMRGVPVIAMSRDGQSPLGQIADCHISIAVPREADPLGLAPTSSTTVTMALGDALAAGLMSRSDFSSSDFGVFHPGGALGKQLGTGTKR